MSVRDKYRSTVNELHRAESVPEKISVFRKTWAWVIIASQNVVARYGIVIIPLYLIILSWWNFGTCDDIPLFLFLIGLMIFICTLYTPFYNYGKKKALQDRQDRINNHLEPLHEGEVLSEEVNKFIPLRMNRICNFAFTFILTLCPIFTYWTFNMFSSHDHCNSLIYWTAFVISVIYSFWVITLLSACLLCCCFLAIHQAREKFQGSRNHDIEEA